MLRGKYPTVPKMAAPHVLRESMCHRAMPPAGLVPTESTILEPTAAHAGGAAAERYQEATEKAAIIVQPDTQSTITDGPAGNVVPVSIASRHPTIVAIVHRDVTPQLERIPAPGAPLGSTPTGDAGPLRAVLVRTAGITLGITGVLVFSVPMVRSRELTAQTATTVVPASMPIKVGAPAAIAIVAGTRTMPVSGIASIVVQASTKSTVDRPDAKIALPVTIRGVEEGGTVIAALAGGIHTLDGAGVIGARMAKVSTTTKQAATTVVAINIPDTASVTIVQGAELLTLGRRAA